MKRIRSQRYPFIRLLMPLLPGILCGEAFSFEIPTWIYNCTFILIPTLLLLFHRFHAGKLFGTTLFLELGLLGFIVTSNQLSTTNYSYKEKEQTYLVLIQETPEEKTRSLSCKTILIGEYDGCNLIPCKNAPQQLLYFPKTEAANTLRQGDSLLIHAYLSPPRNNGLPDEFDYARYLKRKGITGTAYVSDGSWKVIGHKETYSLKQKAENYRKKVVALFRELGFKNDNLSILSALTVGEKEELSEEIKETYSVSGASHVLALSGLHIGILYALFYFLSTLVWRRRMWLKPICMGCIVVVLWGFALLTGCSPSVIRSVTMFSLLAFATLQPERILTLNSLAASAFFMLLIHPMWLFEVGFQMSFLAVASIVIIQPRLMSYCKTNNRFIRKVWGLITVSIAAQLGVAPLIILYFGRFSTHFIVTNLWIIPLVTVILYLAIIMLLVTPFPLLQQPLSTIVRWLINLQNDGLRWIEHWPYSSVDNIWMDKWSTLLIYIVIVSCIYLSTKRTIRAYLMMLTALFLFVGYNTFCAFKNSPKRSINIYNVRGCPVLHCIGNDAHSWFICTDSTANTALLNRLLTPYYRRLKLVSPQEVSDDYQNSILRVREQIVTYAGKQVAFVNDNRWKFRETKHPLSLSFIYLSGSFRGNIEELKKHFNFHTIIVDATLPSYYQNKLKKECSTTGITFLSPIEKGTVSILF